MVTCAYITDDDIQKMKHDNLEQAFRKNIQTQLLKVDIVLKKTSENIHFDSEEACNRQHQGLWHQRLKLN